jgi:IS5 family transposase
MVAVNEQQPSLSEVEYSQRRRVPRREEFLNRMDAVVPWAEWVGLIQPYYYNKARGRRPVPLETMLRMYLLQVWFHLSDEGVEDQINDSFAMRQFMRLDFATQQVPDATTLLHFRHLVETHQLGQAMFASLNAKLEADGLIMRGGSIVDATIIAAPSSTKNATATRDPEMRQTRKGQQWYFGMKAHAGVDAGTGLVHSVTVTGANVHDLDEITRLVRADDQVVYADAGYQGVEKRPDIAADRHLSQVTWQVAARKGVLKTMPAPDRQIESRKASVRAKVEHVFLILKRDFAFAKTRYRGLAKNLNLVQVAMASANLLMLARATVIQTRLTTPATTG